MAPARYVQYGISFERENGGLSSLRILKEVKKYSINDPKITKNHGELTEIAHVLLLTLVMCLLQPEARSQAKLGQAKPGLTSGLGWASAWPEVLSSQSQAQAVGLGPSFIP